MLLSFCSAPEIFTFGMPSMHMQPFCCGRQRWSPLQRSPALLTVPATFLVCWAVSITSQRAAQRKALAVGMRSGRTDEQKRALSAGLLRVVSEATGESADNIFFVIREGRGINFVEHGQHLPEFVEGAANDKDLIARLK
jgi:phenylpyruvate tautomerase PptA (4-oxalocrotonate tautomerase family)